MIAAAAKKRLGATESRSTQGELDVFRAFFEHGPVCKAIIAAPAGTILRVNASLASMLGVAMAELEGTSFLAMTHPDDLPAAREAMRAVLRGERAGELLEKRLLVKDGRTIWVNIMTGFHRASDGTVLHVLAHVVDITASREAAIHAIASETRYRRLFESAKDGILILDADSGRIVDVNPFMTELTGNTREEFLAAHLWEIGPFKDAANSKVSFAELKAKDYVRYEDLPLRSRDGHEVAVEFISNVYLVDGKRVIQCNIRDITARKRVESERARLAAAIAQAGEAVIVTDAEGIIEYVNPAFEVVTGYSREEVLGRNPRLLKSGMQDPSFYRSLWETIGTGAVWRGRLINRKKDGSLLHEDATISSVRVAGVITSYVAVKRDVTATIALQAQFLQSQKMEAVGRLAGGVAHDFNNALSVILSYTELICGDLKRDEPLRADIEEIRTSALRAAELTSQLLAFSRHQVLQPQVLSLNESLAGMETMLGRLLGADIEITILPERALWNVKADPGQVEQILMNLAINARDAMSQGGKLTVETKNVELNQGYAGTHHDVQPGSYVELAVTDTGCGMDEETVSRVFEPFFTTKATGKGTGLGLATVFGIVKQSGGHIFVYSEPGVGTTFKVYFPKIGSELAHKRRSLRPEAPDQERGSATILLVEDEDQLRIVARNILRRQGYVVLDAPNGGEALLICEQHKANIDVLLTDVVLPRMSGRQLAERLAPIRPAMKVLYMSGYTNDAILQHGIIESGVAFLQKPFTPTSLTRKVREVLTA
jgi:two-component system, cell cycle sensor histidine kinase and response regulator CckA